MNTTASSPWTQVFGFSVLDHVPVGSCVLNSRYEVVFWNKVLEHWTGVDRWEILNHPITEHFPQLGTQHYRLRLEQIFRGGPPLVFSSQLHGQLFAPATAERKLRLQHTTVTGIPTHDGSGCLACFAVEDVSEVTARVDELKETRDRAEQLADQARQANRAKSEFLANMSHELRTPLNSILLMSDILVEDKNNNLSEVDRNSVQIINQSGEALLELVTDILDYSKAEAGKGELIPEKVDLAGFLRQLEESTGLLITHKGLDYTVEVGEDVPAIIETDPQALTRIARNLLSNAAKFTPQGRVILRLERAGEDQTAAENPDGRRLSLSVTDTGPGIAPERHEAIFDPFCQEDSTISRQFGGTGLGLSISRQLADMLGGHLTLKSQPGKGSCFTLVFPTSLHSQQNLEQGVYSRTTSRERGRKQGSDRPGQAAAKKGIRANDPAFVLRADALEGLNILVAEDDMRSLYTLAGLLESAGATVTTATEGQDTLRALETQSLDLVMLGLIDQDLVDSPLQEKIRQLVKKKDLTLICTNTWHSPEDCRGCRTCLVRKDLDQPGGQRELISRLEKLLPSRV